MVINEDGLITDNQNTYDNTLYYSNKIKSTDKNGLINDTIIENVNVDNNSCFDLNSSTESKKELIDDNSINLENTISNSVDDNSVDTNANDSIQLESHEKEQNKSIETNCLALTVQKDYNFAIAKNTVFKTIRMSIKVAISTLVLNVIKLFF